MPRRMASLDARMAFWALVQIFWASSVSYTHLASTEVVRFAHGQLVSAVSCPVGSLKLYRDWVKKILPNQQAVESMKKAIRQATRGLSLIDI